MKNISRKMLTTAMTVAGSSALGILLVKLARDSGKRRDVESPCGNKKREKLLRAKNKLEMLRERLDRHLIRINARIEAVNKAKSGTT